jgi:hypothetical protein
MFAAVAAVPVAALESNTWMLNGDYWSAIINKNVPWIMFIEYCHSDVVKNVFDKLIES